MSYVMLQGQILMELTAAVQKTEKIRFKTAGIAYASLWGTYLWAYHPQGRWIRRLTDPLRDPRLARRRMRPARPNPAGPHLPRPRSRPRPPRPLAIRGRTAGLHAVRCAWRTRLGAWG